MEKGEGAVVLACGGANGGDDVGLAGGAFFGLGILRVSACLEGRLLEGNF